MNETYRGDGWAIKVGFIDMSIWNEDETEMAAMYLFNKDGARDYVRRIIREAQYDFDTICAGLRRGFDEGYLIA